MRGLYRGELSRLPAYCRADCCHHETIAPAPAAALSHVDPSAARKDQHPAIARLRPSLYGLWHPRSEEHTSELQSLMRISYAVFCLKKKKQTKQQSQYRNTIYITPEQQRTHHQNQE